ncbi:MAG: TatD family hydrolase [Polyangiaceae bacterium]
MLIDSHCHLEDGRYAGGRAGVLERARAAGVTGFVAIGVGEDAEPARQAVAIAGEEPDVWAAVGLHPHDARCGTDALVAELTELARAPRVVAFGEIGLDYHYMHSEKDTQIAVFRRMIGVAKELRLPIVVHTRSAAEDTLTVLEEESARDVGGIIHCFSEDVPFARRALDMDFDLSFSGIVTFKTAAGVRDAARFCPADRILLETDSPYLAPVPLRGKKCEPAFIVHTAKAVAELRGVPVEELCRSATANTVERLRLPASR